MQFEHATIPVSTKHGVGWLESFNAQAEFPGWTKHLKDTADFEQHGRKFLTELINGEAEKVRRMLPGDLRKDVGVEQLKKIQDACRENLGAADVIEYTSKEHRAEDDVWRLNYKISAEKQETTGYVDYDFNAFDGRIFGFRVRFQNDE